MTHKSGLSAEEFRKHGHDVVDWIADYLGNPEKWPVTPDVKPGDVSARLPLSPPANGEPMEDILSDFRDIIVPASTQWNHPGFMAYFAYTGSAEGVLGETLAAALDVNAMLWRTGPAATELEFRTMDWVRQMIGLPPAFLGTITDTASTSTLYALAAARELHPELLLREQGLAGRSDLPKLRVYASEEAHSSVDKAVMTLGLGVDGLRHVPTDGALAMDPRALAEAVASDRRGGVVPLAVVATVGTTSTNAIDPVPAIAGICEREKMWLHVDGAYGGNAAMLPEMRFVLDGCDRADSLVVNPHKWMLTPMDCSALFTRRPELLKWAFHFTPEYLTVAENQSAANLMDYGLALGRRFRALKLWMIIRSYGVDGMAAVIREHIRLAGVLSGWIDAEGDFERLADGKFSTVVFRYANPRLDEAGLERANASILERVNERHEVFISHTRVRGRYALRISIGNLRTEEKHIRRAWELIREAAHGV